MKRLLFVFILIFAMVLAGCANVSEEEHNAVVSERDQLKTQLEELQAEYKEMTAELEAKPEMREIVIRGSFSATVQEVLPNYVLDGETPWFAVVTQYLDDPVILNLGEELAAQVEEGEIYVFTIAEKRIEAAVDKAWEAHSLTAYRGFEIKSVRLAEEDEMGVVAPALEYIFADEFEARDGGELRSLTEVWLEGEFHRVYDQYYDIQELTISNWHQDGNEATFFYKMTWLNWNRDPDTVEYIRTAKENGSPNYEKLYEEYLGIHEANYEFKIVLEEDGLKLYSNVSPKGTQWEPTKVDDYVMR